MFPSIDICAGPSKKENSFPETLEGFGYEFNAGW